MGDHTLLPLTGDPITPETLLSITPSREAPQNTSVKLKINPNWIAGFADAEGCFDVDIYKSRTTVGYGVTLRFRLVQHSRDLDLMESIRDFLGCGTIVSKEKTGTVILVRKLIDIIVPLFKKNNLHGTKKLDFEDFCKVCDLMNNKEHLTTTGFKKIQ